MKQILFILVGFALASSTVQQIHAEQEKLEFRIITELLDEMAEIDPDNDAEVKKTLGETYLKCAATFKTMSTSLEDERPAVANLLHEKHNSYLLVGMAILADKGQPVNSTKSYADAYVELYGLDHILHFSEHDLETMIDLCNSPNMTEYGENTIAGLESQIDE